MTIPPMRVTLDGRVALVTGAASGIGRASARLIAASGVAGLVLVDRNAKGCAEVAEALPGTDVATVVADLAEPDAVAQVLSAAIDRFGRIDALVNAAALTTRASFEDATVATWDTLFAVNARAPFFLMQGVIADMKRRGVPGSIVNVLSMNAHCGATDLSVYAATKGALQTLTKNAANAYLHDLIRVNGLNLGWVRTEAEHHMQSVTLGQGEDWAERVSADMPLGRLLTPEECARHILFLLSDASAPMTGVVSDLEQRVIGAPPA